MHAWSLLLCVLTICFAPSMARAACGSDAEAAAQALFEEANKLIEKQDFAAACLNLEEAEKICSSPGSAFNLAACYEQVGRFASALTGYQKAAAAAADRDRSKIEQRARDRVEALRPKISYVIIAVPSPVDGLIIQLNRVSLGRPAWNVKLPIDPGAITISASAEGHEPWLKTVQISAEPSELTVDVPPLVALPPPPSPDPQPVVVPPAAAQPTLDPGTEVADGSTQRVIGVVLGVTGLVVMGVSIGFGVHAVNQNDASNDGHCNDLNQCDAAGLSLRQEALNAAGVSTGLLVAGVGIVASGALVYLLADF